MNRSLNVCVAIALIVACGALSAQANTISYFQDGSSTDLQGWTNVWTSTDGSGPIQLHERTFGSVVSVIPENAFGGTGPSSWLMAQSPVFQIDGSGDLSFALCVGDKSSGAFPASLPSTQPATTDGGPMGVALMDLSGNFVLTAAGTANSWGSWAPYSFTQAALAPYVGQKFRLAFIDGYSNGNGNNEIALTRVSVPGSLAPVPEPGTVVLLLTGLVSAAGFWFRRKAA